MLNNTTMILLITLIILVAGWLGWRYWQQKQRDAQPLLVMYPQLLQERVSYY